MSAGAAPLVRRTRRRAAPPTRGGAAAAASLGVLADDLAPDPPDPPALTLDPARDRVVLVIGPSGSGKSTLLADAAAALAELGWAVREPDRDRRLPDRPAVDLVARAARAPGVHGAMRLLARAGLADARAIVRRPAELSAGQRARLRLALALARAERDADRRPSAPVLLVLDEFGSGLDRPTAAGLLALVAAWVRDTPGAAALIATCDESLADETAALDAVLDVDRRGRVTRRDPHAAEHVAPNTRPTARRRDELTVEPAGRAELEELADLHYRPGPPAVVERVLAARSTRDGRLLGVLVASRPVLNGSHRELAWPGRFRTGDKAADAGRLNDELRTISRVIVDPRDRGRGVATALVAAYLAEPDTPCTEALAAMGRASNFFAAAGMTPYDAPPGPRDARLLDTLEHLRVPRWRLATPDDAWRHAADVPGGQGLLARELRRWAVGRRAARRPESPAETLARAARVIAAEPLAYAHTAPPA